MFGIKERIRSFSVGLTVLGLLGLTAGVLTRAQTSPVSAIPTPVSASVLDALKQRDAYTAQLPDGRWLRLENQQIVLVDSSNKGVTRSFPLPAIRIGASAAVLPNGHVLIWGGTDTLGQLLSEGEWFDPATGQYSVASPKGLKPVAGHTMTVLTNGDVLVAGGVYASGNSAEHLLLWHPATADSTAITTALSARAGQVATLLRDGTVSLTGGIDLGGSSVAESQLFDPSNDTLTNTATTTVDSAQLLVTASTPVANSSDNAAATPVSVRFSTPVDPRSVSAATVSLIGPAGPVGATINGVQNGRLAFLIPSNELLTGSAYTIVLSGVRSSRGQALPFTSIGFRTASLSVAGAKGTTSEGSNTSSGNSTSTTGGAAVSTASTTSSIAGNLASPQNVTVYRTTGIDAQGRPLAAVSCNSAATAVHLCRNASYIKDGAWYPGQDNAGTPGNGHWRLNVHDISATEIANQAVTQHAIVKRAGALATRAGATSSVAGQVKLIDGQAVSHVQITLGTVSTYTDSQGRFTLAGVPTGRQSIFVDGSTANHPGYEYGQFLVGVDVLRGGVTQLPYRMYLPRILARDKIELSSPTTQDMVVTHPDIPGLEIHIPAGTVIHDHNGKIVTELAVVPTPVDRAPFPVPVNFPVYFSIQPSGATVQNLDPHQPQGITLTYPNYSHVAAGTTASFIAYDPTDGWKTYGQGAITSDGNQLKPEAAVHLAVTAPASWNVNNTNTGDPQAAKPDGPCCGDPVDLNSGTLVENQTDAVINDVIPISLTRSWHGINSFSLVSSTYSQDKRSFGGWRSNYDMFVYAPSASWTDPNLGVRLADGYLVSPFSYIAPQPGQAVSWQYTGTVPRFVGAILNITNDSTGYALTLRDGTQYLIDEESGLYMIRDRFGNAVTITRTAGLVTQVTSPNGRYLSFNYDANNNVTSVVDNTGRTWTYTYHKDTVPTGGWALDTATPPGTNPPASAAMYFLDKVTYPDSTYISFTYDENFSPPTAGSGSTGTISYSACPFYRVPGTLLTMVDRNSHTVMTNNYCSLNVTKQTLADGAVYQFAYQRDGSDNPIETDVTDPLSNLRKVVWDANSGYPSSDTEGAGTSIAQTTTYQRDQYGQVQSMTDALNRVTNFQRDPNGNVTQVTSLAGTANAVNESFTWTTDFGQLSSHTDALGHKTTFTYTQGCLTGVTDPLGHSTSITCNAAGQPVQITDALSHVSTLNYSGTDLRSVTDALNRTVTFAVDPLGRMTAVTDPLGNVSLKQYDTNDRVMQFTDPLNQTTKVAYDNNGNPTSVTLPSNAVIKATYDTRNRRITRTDALNKSESWTYDGLGNVLTHTDRKGQLTTYAARDALDRFTKVTFADNSTVTATTYDAGNRLLQLTDSVSGTTTRTYDGLDRMTGETTSQGSVAYTYYANGLRQTMTPASQATVNYVYDNANRLTGLTQGTESVGFTYDNTNRRATLTLPNGITATYGYDAANQLTGITYTTSGNSTVGNIGYSYDNGGRRIGETGSLASSLMPTATSANGTFDLNNQQTAFNAQTLTYDADGNLTNDGTNTYTWNARNQLSQIQQGATTTASFTYDTEGRRIAKTISGITTDFLYDGANTVQETQGSVVNPILTGLAVDERFARNEGSTRSYFLTDALGSTVALTNAGASLIQQYQYDPYGNATETASTTNPYLYTGREVDGTGLYYYRARYYNPSVGRFISEDPLGFGGRQNNFYGYVGNDPLTYRDPSGKLIPEAFIGAGIGGLVGYIDGRIQGDCDAKLRHDIAVGAASGFALGLTDGLGLVGGAIANSLIGAGSEAGRQYWNGGGVDNWGDVLGAGALSALGGAFSTELEAAAAGPGQTASKAVQAAAATAGDLSSGAGSVAATELEQQQEDASRPDPAYESLLRSFH